MYPTKASSFSEKPSITRAPPAYMRADSASTDNFSHPLPGHSICHFHYPLVTVSFCLVGQLQWHLARIMFICVLTLRTVHPTVYAENPLISIHNTSHYGPGYVAAWWQCKWRVLLFLLWCNYRAVAGNAISSGVVLKSTVEICNMQK